MISCFLFSCLLTTTATYTGFSLCFLLAVLNLCAGCNCFMSVGTAFHWPDTRTLKNLLRTVCPAYHFSLSHLMGPQLILCLCHCHSPLWTKCCGPGHLLHAWSCALCAYLPGDASLPASGGQEKRFLCTIQWDKRFFLTQQEQRFSNPNQWERVLSTPAVNVKKRANWSLLFVQRVPGWAGGPAGGT